MSRDTDRAIPTPRTDALDLLATIRRALPTHGTRSDDAINACESLAIQLAELRAVIEKYAGEYSAPVPDYTLRQRYRAELFRLLAIDAARTDQPSTDHAIPPTAGSAETPALQGAGSVGIAPPSDQAIPSEGR